MKKKKSMRNKTEIKEMLKGLIDNLLSDQYIESCVMTKEQENDAPILQNEREKRGAMKALQWAIEEQIVELPDKQPSKKLGDYGIDNPIK